MPCDIVQRVRSPTWTLLAVALGTFMLLLDVTIVVVALPAVQTSLGASFGDLQWTLDAYALSLASFLLAAGSLADLYGRRRLFEIGLLVFTLGSLLCGAAPSASTLVLFRAVQGVGGAIMFATSLALLAHAFRGADRGMAFGVWGAVAGVSTALGPVLGGILTSSVGWRWIFLVNLPVGAAGLFVTRRFVQESTSPARRRVDLPGFVVFTLGLLGLVHALIRASEHDWHDGLVLTSLAVGVVCLVAFPFLERKTSYPMFDLSLFRKPTFVGGSVAAFGMNGSLFAMFIYFVMYLQRILHFNAMQTGVRLAFITGATLVTALATGRIATKVPVRWTIGVGLVLVGAGLLAMRGITAISRFEHLIPGFILAGIGSGLVNPALASTAVGVVDPARSGMASGINNTFRQVGIATSIAALGSIFASRHPSNAEGFADTMNLLLLVSASVALASGVLAWTLIRQSDFVAQGDAAPTSPSEGARALTTTKE